MFVFCLMRSNVDHRIVVVFYELVALERRFNGPVIITSTQGGSNIEEIAAENPDAIIQHPINIEEGLHREEALSIADRLGFRNDALQEVRFLELKR